MPLSRLQITAILAMLLLLAVVLTILLRPTTRSTLLFYASPTGSGSSCTETAPCRIADWWPLATPGATLVLMDGTYRRSQGGNIDPPDTLAGTASQPITVKALNDGAVLIDAEHGGFAVYTAPGNDYFHVIGINATRGGEALYRLRGDYNRAERVIGWEGTTGSADSNIFSLEGIGTIVVDGAGWGQNARKIWSGSQTIAAGQMAGWQGCRRCWMEWNDHPMGVSGPTNTYQVGYRTRQQRLENVIGTVRFTGDVRDFEGVVSAFYDCPASDISMAGTAILGSLFYLLNGQSYGSEALNTSSCTRDMLWKDVATVLESSYTNVAPFRFLNDPKPPQAETNNRCENCLSVHAGRPTINQDGSGWTLPGFREGRGVAEAMGGASVYDVLPGLCYRIENGVVTTQGLYPWPMEERIRAARVASGAPEVEVTKTVEQLLGPIPDKCRGGSAPIPPDPVPPPLTSLSCTGQITQVPGPIQLACQPVTRAR